MTTGTVTPVDAISASCSGNVSNDGGAVITDRGICWSTGTNPSTADSKTMNGTGIGDFIGSITGLSPNITYYLRAYAVNSVGVSYGDVVQVTTKPTLPVVTTGSVTPTSATTASCNGNISSDGGVAVMMRGICWGTGTNPTTADSKTSNGTGIGDFTGSITGLSPNITYYVRAYAVNSVGTGYGNALQFKTTATLPSVTTGVAKMLTTTTATCEGNASADGGVAITSRGVCWSTTPHPTTLDTKNSDGTGTGSFTASLTGLIQGTTYYIRAYAVNSIGTNYGNEITMNASLLPTITTLSLSELKTTSLISGGNITSDGGSAVTVRGLCWSTSANPTLTNSHTSDGSGSGTFSSRLTGLTQNTLYYLRAYATNSSGTAYGQQTNIVTSFGEVTDVDGNVYQTVKIGDQVWMTENFKATRLNDGTAIENASVNNNWNMSKSPAYSWYNNDASRYKNGYGVLYNGYAVASGKLAPAGWHVPTTNDWKVLSNNAGGYERLMETGTTHWNAPAIGNNFTGFTAIPAGFRNIDGTFTSLGITCKWWNCEVINELLINCCTLETNKFDLDNAVTINNGLSVRLIKGTVDLPVVTSTHRNTRRCPHHFSSIRGRSFRCLRTRSYLPGNLLGSGAYSDDCRQ